MEAKLFFYLVLVVSYSCISKDNKPLSSIENIDSAGSKLYINNRPKDSLIVDTFLNKKRLKVFFSRKVEKSINDTSLFFIQLLDHNDNIIKQIYSIPDPFGFEPYSFYVKKSNQYIKTQYADFNSTFFAVGFSAWKKNGVNLYHLNQNKIIDKGMITSETGVIIMDLDNNLIVSVSNIKSEEENSERQYYNLKKVLLSSNKPQIMETKIYVSSLPDGVNLSELKYIIKEDIKTLKYLIDVSEKNTFIKK
jgi:hypothetical protein